jgi:hypothetical protein
MSEERGGRDYDERDRDHDRDRDRRDDRDRERERDRDDVGNEEPDRWGCKAAAILGVLMNRQTLIFLRSAGPSMLGIMSTRKWQAGLAKVG